MIARPRQLRISLPAPRTHGGARKGAGRKPRGERAGVTHHGRPELTALAPVHVTLKVLPHVWNLRTRRVLAIVESALDAMKTWREFRVVHFSVQGDHLHFIVEADDNRALSEGMQGLSVRLAKGLNRLMGRHGKVFADRFHAHVLRTPAEARNALAYVLLNNGSHMARIGKPTTRVDRFSSAAAFDGWRELRPVPTRVTSRPQTWLLRSGWRRRGALSLSETPALPTS